MQKTGPFLLGSILFFLLFGSCKSPNPIKTQMDEKYTVCYIAIDKADTAWLKLDTGNLHLLGELKFSYANKNQYEGPVKAIMKGDTLRGNFSFKLNQVDRWYKNPIALLKRGNTFTMGIGEIMTLWGSGYFNKNIPISYDRGRFVFEEVHCKVDN